jgi:NAD+ kinase
MSDSTPGFKKIVIAAHPQAPEAAAEAAIIAAVLQEHGVATAYGLLYDEALRQRVRDQEFDALIALGGDGTMLRAGHLCAPLGIPILGINMGRIGFLIEIRRHQWRDILPRFLQGDFWLERRMMITAEHWRNGELMGSWQALNEAAVSRGQLVRPIHLEAYLDSHFLTTYVADALIAATPTGSTGYALAAGGPILPPEVRNILLVAVAPHLTLDRAIVLAEDSQVSITVHTDHQAVLSVDGQAPITLADGDHVDAHCSENSVLFVRFQDRGYFYRNLTSHTNKNPITGSQK